MEELYILQSGNYINHRSGLGNHDFAEIIEMEELDERVLYRLTHRLRPDGFVGYDDQINGILLRPEHLTALGFTENPNNGYLELLHHSISYQGYTKFENGKQINVAAHMRIFRPLTPVPQNRQQTIRVEDFENNTIPLLYIHAFQNYCSANGIAIDFRPIRTFQNQW